MMKDNMLELIDEILRKLARTKEDSEKPFGNKTIILFGDLCQLPPVILNPLQGLPIY